MVCERLGREPFWRRGEHPHGSLLPSPPPLSLPIFSPLSNPCLRRSPFTGKERRGGFKVLPLRERAKPANAIKRYARARKGMVATASNAAKIAAQGKSISAWRRRRGSPRRGKGLGGRRRRLERNALLLAIFPPGRRCLKKECRTAGWVAGRMRRYPAGV